MRLEELILETANGIVRTSERSMAEALDAASAMLTAQALEIQREHSPDSISPMLINVLATDPLASRARTSLLKGFQTYHKPHLHRALLPGIAMGSLAVLPAILLNGVDSLVGLACSGSVILASWLASRLRKG